MMPPAAAPALNPAWSLMRCVFAFEICLIHLCSISWYKPQEGWMAETVFMSAARTGTIGFMMLAGAILVGRDAGGLGDYLAHRLRRWLPALAVAQVVYIALDLWSGGATLASLTMFDAVEPAWYHIWFFYALGFVYLAVVPMRWYAGWAATLPPAPRLAAIWAPVALLMGVLGWATLLRGGFWGDLRLVNLLAYAGYAWAGYALAATFPRGAAFGWWMVLAGVSAAAIMTAVATEAAGEPVSSYFHRCSGFVAVAAMGQFLLLLRVSAQDWREATLERLHGLARLTLGIFVVHPLLISLAGWPQPWALAESAEWVSMPVAAVVLFAASGLVTWLVLAGLAALRRPAARAANPRGG